MATKIALILCLLLCLFIVAIGVGLWWIPSALLPDFVKAGLSIPVCAAGIALGGVVVEMLIDEF